MNVDRAAVERAEEARAARETAERIATLRHNIFRNAENSRNVDALTNESAAARLLISASDQALSFLVLGILRVAIDNRWSAVVRAGIKHFDDHPTAAAIQELWDLTLATGRSAV